MPDDMNSRSDAFEAQTADVPRVQWRVLVDGKVYGPYPRGKLLEFLSEGRVAGHTMLSCGADTQFHRADEHPNLRWDFTHQAKHGAPDRRRSTPTDEDSLSNYFISARILAGVEAFERVLLQVGKFARAGSGMWVLRSKMTLPQLRNQLSVALRKDEQFVIVNATTGRLAWFNLGAEHDVAVRSVWNAELTRERY